jgi:hypothetical protein
VEAGEPGPGAAGGAREIQISGGRGVVAGDYNNVFQYFGQAPRPLASAILSGAFQPLVDERTRHFVGRDFVFDAIDGHLRDGDFGSGYVVIQGEPGIGKTALLAQLVKTRGWVHHFNVASLGIRSPQSFISNVCAQLIVRHQLDHPVLPPDAAMDGSFLAALLSEAAARAESPPIVIAVDALDEAEDANVRAGANRLFLPSSLPAGVHFVVTTRPAYDYQLLVDERRDIVMRDDDPRNRQDVQTYIDEFVARGGEVIAGVIAGWGVSTPTFVDVLTEKSEGNFMYVVHVLRDIRNGTLTADTVERIDGLPQGLIPYYRRHWNQMRSADPERFRLYEEPVIGLLATVREPVDVGQVVAWTRTVWSSSRWPLDRFAETAVADVVHEWREFLNEDRAGGGYRYRVYHASFQEFLRDQVGLASYHRAIGTTALDRIPGFGGP